MKPRDVLPSDSNHCAGFEASKIGDRGYAIESIHEVWGPSLGLLTLSGNEEGTAGSTEGFGHSTDAACCVGELTNHGCNELAEAPVSMGRDVDNGSDTGSDHVG